MKEKRWLGTQKYELHCFYCGGFHITGNCPQMKRIILNCKECGKPVEVEDMSDLFEGGQVVTCDACYQRIQAEGEAAAAKVREEWKECGED